MTREEKQLLRKIEKIVRKVAQYIGDLKGWSFEIYAMDQLDADFGDGSAYTVAAYSDPKWEYKHCKLYFNLDELKTTGDYGITAVVVHELYHAAISEMREWHPDYESINPQGKFWRNRVKHEESVVTALSDGTLALLKKCGII